MLTRQLADERIVMTTFDSDLGWMAIAASGAESGRPVLTRLTFGHRARATAAAGLGLSKTAATSGNAWPQLVERLTAYAAGEPEDFADVAVDLAHRTPLQRRILEQCRRIPYGQTLTYGRLATLAGSPGAARAVGNVMAQNRCALVIPCHRVVQAGGAVGHYSAPAGRRMKLRLLEQEGAWQGGKLRSLAVAGVH